MNKNTSIEIASSAFPRIALRMAAALVALVACVALASNVGAPHENLFAPEKAYAADAEAPAETLDIQAATSSTILNQPTKKQRKAFRVAAADFSIDLLKRCVASKGGNANVTVSPLSVMDALAVTANGAAGATSAEMRNVLGDGMSMKSLNQALSWYNSKLVNTRKARLRTANGIWYTNDGSLSIKNSFLKKAKNYYNAQVSAADFASPQTVADINGFVAQNTNNMIKRIIDRLESDAKLVIVNALYFDAKWANPFDKAATWKAPFTSADGTKKKVDMMHATEGTYLEGDGVVGFMKPYAKGYSYVALLPDEGVKINDFVSTLTGKRFRTLLSKKVQCPVDVALPKQKLEYSDENLQEQLAAMGMERAFSPKANFSKMGTSADGNLYLGEVIHKTKVEIDEAGTKAAAATAVVAKATSAGPRDVKCVTLDRPFVYAIVDNTAKLPLFIGTVNDITAQ
ncbi:MAG: serpin family protein [Eggerthellaceae bacterium]|nr:serpin family protein [Eggerthellaceae bacterium]